MLNNWPARLKYPTFAIDWDGTAAEDVWPAHGDWLPGAPEALRELEAVGTVVIHTCRVSPSQPWTFELRDPALVRMEKEGIRKMLNAEGLQNALIWDKPWKPAAVAYVDNKGVHYNGRKGAWKALVPKLMVMAGLEPVIEEEA